MILFKTIRWKNILSTGNFFTEVPLSQNQTTLIVGDNGSGKSTLLDALTYVLFNKPFRKINKPQLINSITKKSAVVEIEFSVGPVDYKVVRGMKPNVFELYQNGKLLNQDAETKDYQSILENHILKVNYRSFCQVVVLGSASFVPFMQLPAGQRRDIIEDLLDLQIFTAMNQVLKEKIYLNDDEVRKFESEKKVLSSKIELMRQHLKEMQDNDTLIIEEKKQRISDAEEEIQTYASKIKDLSLVIESMTKKLGDEAALSSKLKNIEKIKQKLDLKISHLKNEVDFFSDHENCPTCNQSIDEEVRKDKIDLGKEKMKEIEQSLPELMKEYTSTNEKMSTIIEAKSKMGDKKLELNTVQTKMNSMISYKMQVENEITNMSQKTHDNKGEKIEEVELELQKIEKTLEELSENQMLYSTASAMLKDGGIKARIIKQYVPVINKLINKYLSVLDFFVDFQLDENFEEKIKSRYRDEFSYASFSEGEKMRLDLAVLFTWRAVAKLRNSINTNLVIMDEVFDGALDVNGVDELTKLLTNVTKDTNTFIISHKTDAMIDKFDKVYRFQKIKNFSKLVT